jgi:diguanylate cyclase (GGDEF)-like protein
MADVDFFKKVNDTYGHMAGDHILREMGRLMMGILRKGDLGGRYGGEEVIFFLRETPLPGAVSFAERVRKIVESHPFIHEGKKIPITISMGVATSVGDNFSSPDSLIKAADEFLYKAKQSGRNRVVSLMSQS